MASLSFQSRVSLDCDTYVKKSAVASRPEVKDSHGEVKGPRKTGSERQVGVVEYKVGAEM